MDTKNASFMEYSIENEGAAAYAQKSSDVFIDIEVRTDDDSRCDYIELDHIPSFKEAFAFLITEARAYMREYLTPFNVLMAKAAAIILIAVLLLAGTVTGIVKMHIANEKKKDAKARAEAEAEIEAAEKSRKEEKRKEVMSACTEVLGKWYEMDPDRDDIRTMLIEVNDDAERIYTIGDESGSFTYSDGRLSLTPENGSAGRTLTLDGEELSIEDEDIRYYRTDAGINSIKFGEFLENNLPGTFDELLGSRFYIYPDGSWYIDSPWVSDKSGSWKTEVNPGCVKVIFEGMGTHFGGGNIYSVDASDYQAEKERLSSGDYIIHLDVNSYRRATSDLP